MIDPATLAAFALVTAATSAVPGPQVLFMLTQTAWRGPRAGLMAIAGLELGASLWFVLAALGIATAARAAPLVFTGLTLAGAAYLAWLGITALRHAAAGQSAEGLPPRGVSKNAFRDAILVAASNPKSLVYVLALLPPFIDPDSAIGPQMLVLASVALTIDTFIALSYLAAGSATTNLVARPEHRRRLDRAVGMVFLLLAGGIVISVLG
jgi:threonine/homoserine/homoserine lactone efflux protein